MSKNLKKEIKVIFQNENILVINKPKSILVHGDGKHADYTVSDWILQNYPEIENVGEDIFLTETNIIKRPGIVHRLDKDTTGILLIAKSEDMFYSLKEQFKNRTIQKNYRAFVYGSVKFDRKLIKAEIGRSKTDFRKWTTNRGIRGEARDAETEYILLKKSSHFSYLDIFPKTGRTHQIRVHLQFDNHPIIGDHLYAGKNFDREKPETNLFFQTQALHAYKIKFKDLDGTKLEFKAEIPEDFKKALKLIS